MEGKKVKILVFSIAISVVIILLISASLIIWLVPSSAEDDEAVKNDSSSTMWDFDSTTGSSSFWGTGNGNPGDNFVTTSLMDEITTEANIIKYPGSLPRNLVFEYF